MTRHRWTQSVDQRGEPYRYAKREMPELPAEFLDAVIYLYPTEADALAGESAGGTGFLTSMPAQNGAPDHIYAVTNAHVVRGPAGPRAPVVRLNASDGVSVLALRAEDWIQHPDGDDIVVAPLGLNPGYHKYFAVPREVYVMRDDLGPYGGPVRTPMSNIGPGDDVFMLGRFVDHDGKQRNSPIVRFGHIAMLPGEPIRLPSGINQESFLVEALSLSGFSGSPVIAFATPVKHMAMTPWGKTWLLGVDWGHIRQKLPVRDQDGKKIPENWHVKQNSGFMGVVPAWKLAELLDCEELSDLRKKQIDEHRKETTDTELDVAESGDQTEAEWGRDDFMRDLDRASRRTDERPPTETE